MPSNTVIPAGLALRGIGRHVSEIRHVWSTWLTMSLGLPVPGAYHRRLQMLLSSTNATFLGEMAGAIAHAASQGLGTSWCWSMGETCTLQLCPTATHQGTGCTRSWCSRAPIAAQGLWVGAPPLQAGARGRPSVLPGDHYLVGVERSTQCYHCWERWEEAPRLGAVTVAGESFL